MPRVPKAKRHTGATAASSNTNLQKRGPHFIDKLDKDLHFAREVYRKQLTVRHLEAEGGQLLQMLQFVERCMAEEIHMFAPIHSSSDTPAQPDHTVVAGLVAWAEGRRRLRRLHEALQEAYAKLQGHVDSVRACERRLKEFAAVREEEMDVLESLDIFGALITFVDRLRHAWIQHESRPSDFQELQATLLAAAPLQMFFGSNCLEEAFNLWLAKSQMQRALPPPQWDSETKHEVLQSLFRLFDTDGNGSVDAEELLVTLKAFGMELPVGTELHYEVVRHFDANGDGRMDITEFQAFVESRIRFAFNQFLQVSGRDANSIKEPDLQVVSEKLGCTGLPDGTYGRMIHMLDSQGPSQDGQIDISEFEQLVLMRPEGALGRISSGHALNLSRSRDSRKCSLRAFSFALPRPASDSTLATAAGE